MEKHDEKYCPIGAAIKIIGDEWSIFIIRELLSGPKRFNEIQEIIDGITSSTLSDRLKKLAKNKIIKRQQYQCIPPKVEYSLTDKGQDLEKIVLEIRNFGEKWLKKG
jgi:DNA-binding HxlR family transcriptional regulator